MVIFFGAKLLSQSLTSSDRETAEAPVLTKPYGTAVAEATMASKMKNFILAEFCLFK